MIYPYHKRYFVFFEYIGQAANLNGVSGNDRRMLGFLIMNSIDSLIYSWISEAYIQEFPSGRKDVSFEEMMEYLHNNASGDYYLLSTDKIIVKLIQYKAVDLNDDIERQIQSDKGRRALKRLLTIANSSDLDDDEE